MAAVRDEVAVASALAAVRAGGWPEGFKPFAERAPLAVMVRSALEWVLGQAGLEQVFAAHAQHQYTRRLTLELLVALLLDVACGIQPSAHAAYRARQQELLVSFQALYAKLGRMEPAVSAAVVARSSALIGEYIARQGVAGAEPLPGYRARILDGTVLAGHDHRLAVLREKRAQGLTGMALAVFAPSTGLVEQVVLAEDAYTQERAQLAALAIAPGELWVADRNFCTRRMLTQLSAAGAAFVLRWHASALPLTALTALSEAAGGQEQRVRLTLPEAPAALELRRLVIPLAQPTRSGERELILLTNLPSRYTPAQLAAVYRSRWRIETHYQRLTELLHCELPGLGYPRAALFAFAMAVLAANALALVLAALRQAHPPEHVEALSFYQLVLQLAQTWHGMLIALPEPRWRFLQHLSCAELSAWLGPLARAAPLARYRKSTRSTPSRARKTKRDTRPHHSIQRLLEQRKNTC